MAFATSGQKLSDVFYQKAGDTISELNQDCSFDCSEMSNKMVTFTLSMPRGEECPKIRPDQTIENLQKWSPCSEEVIFFSSWHGIFLFCFVNNRKNFKCSYLSNKRSPLNKRSPFIARDYSIIILY